MTDAQKIATKKFLHAVKSGIMAMDVDSLKEDALNSVFSAFTDMVDAATPEDSSSSAA